LNGVSAENLNVAQHNTCGTLCLSLGRRREALEHFKAAVRLGREIGYPRDEGYSLRGLGIALETTGDAEGAAEAYRRAAELLEAAYEESGMDEDLAAKAEALNLLATVLHRVLDRRGEALDAYEGAAGIASGTTGAWARSRWDGVACSGG
jgi:tetratricopeptide (TPR) repeat protein